MVEVAPTDEREPWQKLFVPGMRIGWAVSQPTARPFPFPRPVGPVPEVSRKSPRVLVTVSICAGFLLLCSSCGLGAARVIGVADAAGWGTLLDVVPLVGAALIVGLPLAVAARAIGWSLRDHRRRRRYQSDLAQWSREKAAHESAEAERLARTPLLEPVEWPVRSRRLDVVGGDAWGWEALVTLLGSSLVASGVPVTVVDLSDSGVAGELAALVEAVGRQVDVWQLPADLGRLGMFAGLSREETVTVLVEALHGGGESDREGRIDRLMDEWILARIVAALGDRYGPERIWAGLRSAKAEQSLGDLNEQEWTQLAMDQFADPRDALRQRLDRLEAALAPLRSVDNPTEADGTRLPALRCISHAGTGTSGELLTDLLIQWLIHLTRRGRLAGAALFVVGADDIQVRHLERLSNAAARHQVRLTYHFDHLHAGGRYLLGGGAAAIMRLGNAEDAERAAEFIGRTHRFVLSELTTSLGGAETHGVGRSSGGELTGYAGQEPVDGKGLPVVRRLPGIGGRLTAALTRNWGVTRTHETTTNHSTGRTGARTYEFMMEPTVLQNLPDYALLLVESGGGLRTVRAVEVNPHLVTMPTVAGNSPDREGHAPAYADPQ
jgi:hypothetical protein